MPWESYGNPKGIKDPLDGGFKIQRAITQMIGVPRWSGITKLDHNLFLGCQLYRLDDTFWFEFGERLRPGDN